MAELTNLTDRISHLRDRKGGSPIVKGSGNNEPRPAKETRIRLPERCFANDYFIVFVYTLLGIALITQFALIAWLDIV